MLHASFESSHSLMQKSPVSSKASASCGSIMSSGSREEMQYTCLLSLPATMYPPVPVKTTDITDSCGPGTSPSVLFLGGPSRRALLGDLELLTVYFISAGMIAPTIGHTEGSDFELRIVSRTFLPAGVPFRLKFSIGSLSAGIKLERCPVKRPAESTVRVQQVELSLTKRVRRLIASLESGVQMIHKIGC